jgi:hypothetical protein
MRAVLLVVRLLAHKCRRPTEMPDPDAIVRRRRRLCRFAPLTIKRRCLVVVGFVCYSHTQDELSPSLTEKICVEVTHEERRMPCHNI